MDLDIHALRCFVAVVDTGTVTAAAADLGIGQPAVSRQVQQLERRLRVRLFHRDGGRLRLTAAGADLLPASRAALAAAAHVARVAGQLSEGQLDHVRITSTRTTLDDIIAPWLATWPADHPLPHVGEAPARAVFDGVLHDTDLAVGPVPVPTGLERLTIADLPVTAQVPPGHPWAERETVGIQELLGQRLFLLTPEFHARQGLDQALLRGGLHCVPAAEFSAPISMQAVAASGRGVCVATDDPRYGLVCLPIVDTASEVVSIRLRAAWDPAHHGAAALAALAHELRAFVARRYRLPMQ